MTFRIFDQSQYPLSSEINGNFARFFNDKLEHHTRELIDRVGVYSTDSDNDLWGDAYIDSNGRNDSVVLNQTSAVFNTNKYSVLASTDPYVIIEASYLNPTDFYINNCVCVQHSFGKWQINCTTGTAEVKRAQIYKTLFYGTDGSNGRITPTYITGIRKLKTSVSRDVGNYAYYRSIVFSTSAPAYYADITDTFNSVTGNTSVSVWSYVANVNQENISGTYCSSSSAYNTPAVNATVDKFGTDTTAYEKNNPANHYIHGKQNSTSSGSTTAKALILTKATMTEGTPVINGTTPTLVWIDFTTDHSVPVMTATSETPLNIIEHNLQSGIFEPDIKAAILKPLYSDYTLGDYTQFRLVGQAPTTYIIIEASSVNTNSLKINSCFCSKLEEGKYILFSNNTNQEINRARIMKTLFYGTDGSDPRILTPYCYGVTALKSSNSNDVGKRMYYSGRSARAVWSITHTFNDTTTNTGCQVWPYVSVVGYSDEVATIEFPAGSSLVSVNGAGGVEVIDNTESDTSASKLNNPASIKFISPGSSSPSANETTRAFWIAKGTMSIGAGTITFTDFTSTYSIPLFTLANESIVESDTGWLPTGTIKNFKQFSIEPNKLYIKLVSSSTSPSSGYPGIKGFSLYCG